MKLKGTAWMTTAATVAVALMVSGCGTSKVDGAPVTDAAETTTSSGLNPLIDPSNTTTTASGQLMVGDVPVKVEMASPVNELIAKAATDVTEFWHAEMPIQFEFPDSYVAMASSSDIGTCAVKLDIARNCDTGMIWEVPEMQTIQNEGGDGAVLVIVAHEMGHQVQRSMGRDIHAERNADCLAGVYMKSVADGKSSRFKGDTARARNAATQAFTAGRDSVDQNLLADRMAAFADGLRLGSVEQCAALHP